MIELHPELGRALIENYLADQSRLQTPAARFAATHDHGAHAAGALHSSLIPLTAPRPGEQYAFEVNLDACCGCKACVTACHSLNGLDDDEAWRDVGLVVGTDALLPFQQTITTACHHCADPACLNGCPVLAYEKDTATGIVRHLDDQCIGCGYCEMKCPYGVPKFNKRLGIVRKCDMCHGRLTHGEAPACVQACPTHAIRIVTVPAADNVDTSAFLPAAPDAAYTKPTTRYVSSRELPANIAADAGTLRPQHAHWPLIFMLTLLPFAIGLSVITALPVTGKIPAPNFQWLELAAGAAGLAASIFHLGQPKRAWRIFLGLRRSWLSREAVLFGLWFALATAALLMPALKPVAAAVGVAALVCSAMIYVDTRRRFWRAAQTFPRFFGTAAVLSLALVSPPAASYALLAKLAVELITLFGANTSARLQRGPLRATLLARLGFATVGYSLLFLAPAAAVVVLFLGELAERYLFFRATDAPKMPGVAGDVTHEPGRVAA